MIFGSADPIPPSPQGGSLHPHSPQNQLTLSKYYEKLKRGAFLHEILEVADPEEEQFLLERLSLLKAYDDSLLEKKLVETISSLKDNIPLSQIISDTGSKELARMCVHLPGIKMIEMELKVGRETKEVDTNKKLGHTHSLQSLPSRFDERTMLEDSFSTQPRSTYNERQTRKKNTLDGLTPTAEPKQSLRFFDAWKKPASNGHHKPESKHNNVMLDPAHKDLDDEEVITFGDTLTGLTFKEILISHDQYYTWFRWLKYKYKNATADQACAIKAYKYFSKYLKYWDEIEAPSK